MEKKNTKNTKNFRKSRFKWCPTGNTGLNYNKFFFFQRVRVLSKYHVRAFTGQLNLILLGTMLAGLTEESK